MKKLILLVAALVAGLVAYNYVTTGEVTLSINRPSSPEDQEIAALESQLAAARKRWAGASRSAGLTGLDMTADADVARREVIAVQRKLNALLPKLEDAGAKSRGERLEREVEILLGEMR